jgi:curli biogenesis system outer membrane secretion channel CsgG
MMKMRHRMSLKMRMNSRTALTVLALALACIAAPAIASAQIINVQKAPRHDPIERIAEGKAVDKTGVPIGGAVVYLKNTRSNAVRTYIADNDGHFRFGELAQDTDYELWAESNGVRSKSRQISSFDNESKFYFVFKVNVTKPVSLDGPSASNSGLIPQP